MWGVGTLVGPAAGGLFAQFGSWRWAFGVLVLLAVLMAVLVPFALPARAAADQPARDGIPVWSLLLLGSAALVVSVAGIPSNWIWTAVLVGTGMLLVAIFLVVDRRMEAAVLPPTAFRPGPLRWIYLTLGMLMAATMADMYVPFFGQRLAHLVPVAAGFLGVALSVGWTLSEITSASVTRPRVVRAIVMVAPLVMATGLTLAAVSQFSDASVGVIAIWVVALVITGTGVGMAWPHLSAWAMGCVDDPREGARAAAAINTVQLICGAFGAGLAGIVVNLTDRGDTAAPRWLFAVFAVLAVVGCVASYRASRAG
jgi:MFS family permease